MNDCTRCGRPTDSGYVTTTGHLGLDGWLCDVCRESFKQWLDGTDDPLGADCSECGGSVDATVRYKGGGAVDLVLVCSGCGKSGRMGGGH